MTPDRGEEIQVLYEITMAIGEGLELQPMISKSLSIILRKLNCSAGAIHLIVEGPTGTFGFKVEKSIPRYYWRNPGLKQATEGLPDRVGADALNAWWQALPRCARTTGQEYSHQLSLFPHGVLTMIRTGRPFATDFIQSLRPILRKLTTAMTACISNTDLQSTLENLRAGRRELKQYQDHLEQMVRERTERLELVNRELKREIEERKLVEKALAQRSEFERLISKISSRFLRLSSKKFDAGIENALAEIGTFSGVDRAYVFILQKDSALADNTHEWCAAGTEPQIDRLKDVPIYRELPWFGDHIRRGKVFSVSDVTELPPEAHIERKHFESRGIDSLIVVPMMHAACPIGFLGFNAVGHRRIWTGDDRAILQLVGQLFTNAIERRQTEEALRQSEERLLRSKKMESLGLLAGGVAHDLNNVLSGIVSYPDLILMGLPEDSPLRRHIEIIRESGHRAAAIVQDLLTVARGVATPKEPLNLNDVVREYMQSPELKKLKLHHPDVTIKTSPDLDLLNLNGSYVHIRKALMNLVSNASESIEERGQVVISTSNRYIDRPLKGYDTVNIGEYAVLGVSDDGRGISPQDIERIFEPFYTRKVMGRSGTGLGLAVVWNSVQDHHGYIDVDSDETGTRFELYFPVTRATIVDKPSSLSLHEIQGNGETILVVDDVESQRDISCMMLHKLGYNVTSVSSGEEAVAYLQTHTVDLLLLDMIMDPGMNGRETYERVIRIRPGQPAVIASGFTESEEVREAQRLGAGKYLKKPFTLIKLGLAVKEELERD